MWGGALISAVLGTELPGPGTVYRDQSLKFLRPVGPGDTVTVRVKVREKHAETHSVVLDCECVNQSGETVIIGEADVTAPLKKVHRPRVMLPEFNLHERGQRFQELMQAARRYPAIRTAVVHPCDDVSLAGALERRPRG